MKAFKFMKYDIRRSSRVMLLQILLFAPLAILMGYNSDVYMVFTYMALVSIIGPATLFAYEQKSECGFDCMLPAADMDRVAGRFLTGIFFVAIDLILAFILAELLIYFNNAKMPDVSVTILMFVGIVLIYLSISNTIFFAFGRTMNQQIKSFIIMIPAFIMWGLANGVFTIISGNDSENDISSVFMYMLSHKLMLSAIVFCIGIMAYIMAIIISTAIVKKKDFR